MSSTGSKVAQGIALVVGLVLIVAGVRQCTTKTDDVATTSTGSSAGPTTAVGGVPTTTTPPTTAPPGAVTTAAGQATTTVTRTTTTVVPMVGTFEIKPNGASFATSYPYPADPAQPAATPIIEWNVTIPAGQRLEIRGPAPGTLDAALSGGARGQFVPCPGTLQDGMCEVAAGAYAYSAVLYEGDAVVSKKVAVLQIGGGGSGI